MGKKQFKVKKIAEGVLDSILITEGVVFDPISHGYLVSIGEYKFCYYSRRSANVDVGYTKRIIYMKISSDTPGLGEFTKEETKRHFMQNAIDYLDVSNIYTQYIAVDNSLGFGEISEPIWFTHEIIKFADTMGIDRQEFLKQLEKHEEGGFKINYYSPY